MHPVIEAHDISYGMLWMSAISCQIPGNSYTGHMSYTCISCHNPRSWCVCMVRSDLVRAWRGKELKSSRPSPREARLMTVELPRTADTKQRQNSLFALNDPLTVAMEQRSYHTIACHCSTHSSDGTSSCRLSVQWYGIYTHCAL